MLYKMLLIVAASLPQIAFATEEPEYVALGSSYAAGIGLGDRVPDTPPMCMRGSHGYPRLLAKSLALRLNDASCSASTVHQIILSGQGDLPPQIAAISRSAKLVTLTAGGNDVNYVGDMMRLTGFFGAKPSVISSVKARPFDTLKAEMVEVLKEVRRRAPDAVLVVTTYPAIVPAKGSCAALALSDKQADLFRRIADRLASVTRAAAHQVPAVMVVDIAKLSQGHDACADKPWTTGAKPAVGVPFHPNEAGAAATAQAIGLALEKSKRLSRSAGL